MADKPPRHKQPWTADEIAFVRANAGILTVPQIGAALGRGPSAAFVIFRQLKLRREIVRNSTCSECGSPINRRKGCGRRRIFCNRKCSNRFFDKDRTAKRVKLSPRNRQPWTETEYDYLRANYGKQTKAVMAAALGRRRCAVIAAITRLGISNLKSGATHANDQFLRDNRDKGWAWCADQLGKRAHWWLVDPDGSIVDPTASQFPSNGIGEYVELDDSRPQPTGMCPNCGSECFGGNYCCSDACGRAYVAYCTNPR